VRSSRAPMHTSGEGRDHIRFVFSENQPLEQKTRPEGRPLTASE
jgi:hypothetical protein